MILLNRTVLLAISTSALLYAGDTVTVDVSSQYSYGTISNERFDITNLLFSNGAELRLDRINSNDITGPSMGIYAYSFIDSVGTYTYDLDESAPSPNPLQPLSSNAVSSNESDSWNDKVFPAQRGVDTLLYTSTYGESTTNVDSTYPGHLLFDHYRELQSSFAEMNTFSGINDCIYCSVEAENSIRFRFLGFEPDSTYFSFFEEEQIIQWETDSLGNGIFRGESVSQSVPVQKANALPGIQLAQNGKTIQLNSAVSEASLNLYDSRGRLCFTQEFTGAAVKIPALSTGVYFWEISSGAALFSEKIHLN